MCSVAEHESKRVVTSGELDQRIRDYILANPSVIAAALPQAQAIIAQEQLAAKVAKLQKGILDNHDALLADPRDPVIGNPNGDVTVVEFFDNECPYCKSLAPEIDKLIAQDPHVRVVMKEYAILGPISDLSARYALASVRQGKYAAFHAALMTSPIKEHQLTEEQITGLALAAGLNLAQLVADANRPEMAQHLAATHALAEQLGVNGTPSLIVDNMTHGAGVTGDMLAKEVASIRLKAVATNTSAR
jgi:protein-disulfide isomerase